MSRVSHTQSEESNDKFLIELEGWRICADRYNYILQRKYHSKKYDKAAYSTYGYYSKIDDVIEALLDKRLREAEINSLQKLLKEIKSARKEITEIAKSLKELK